MKITILGAGCPKCHQLEENTQKALEALKIDVQIEKITDPSEIMSYGVVSIPVLMVDDEVLAYGRVPDSDEIQDLLKNKL